MLEELMSYLHNWFDRVHIRGQFAVVDGELTRLDGAFEPMQSQYYRIGGSIFNDGLHQHPDSTLVDEVFSGEVWLLAVPQSFIALADEIAEWREAHPDGEYQSESFGGYTYSRPTNADGTCVRWQDQFARELNHWRKLPC